MSLDASAFTPFLIEPSSFSIQPSDSKVSAWSTWSLSLSVKIPIDKACYIQWFLPNEFKYNIAAISASGIFELADQKSELLASDIYPILRADSPKDKLSVTFNGCMNTESLGAEPNGSVDVTEIRT